MKFDLRWTALAVVLFSFCSLHCADSFAADYDESVDGDLANLADGPTLFSVDPGVNTVSGTVGDTDFEDFIGFTIPTGQELASVVLEDFILANGNTSTGFRLYTDDGSGWAQASAGLITPADIGTDFLTVWDLTDVGGSAPLPPGDYGVLLAEFTAGQTYSFSLNVVPEPSGLFGLMVAMTILGLAFRKRG